MKDLRRPASNRISDISHAVQAYVEANGFSVVREYVGHGVGRNMHEAPEIPNYGLRATAEAAARHDDRRRTDGERGHRSHPPDERWLDRQTRDGKYAAHYENTILITAGEPEILTAPAP